MQTISKFETFCTKRGDLKENMFFNFSYKTVPFLLCQIIFPFNILPAALASAHRFLHLNSALEQLPLAAALMRRNQHPFVSLSSCEHVYCSKHIILITICVITLYATLNNPKSYSKKQNVLFKNILINILCKTKLCPEQTIKICC